LRHNELSDPRLPPLVLISGGNNTRLGSLRGTIYKPFLEIQGTTIVAKYIERARREGVSQVVVVTDNDDPLVGRLLASVRESLPGIAVTQTFVDGSVSHKIASVARQLPALEHGLFVSLADTFAWYSFADLCDRRRDSGVDSVLVIGEHSIPFGVVEVDGALIAGFVEKPMTPYLINLGQMYLGPRALALLDAGIDLAVTLEQLATESQLAPIVASAREFLTIDAISDLVNSDLAGGPASWTVPASSP
jgi:NDP-sugar pyrophosphorylase family protein